MHITPYLLLAILMEQGAVTEIPSDLPDANITHVRLLPANETEFAAHCLYYSFALPEDVPALPATSLCLYHAPQTASGPQTPGSYPVCTDQPADIWFNKLLSVFYDLTEWETHMEQAAYREADFQEFIDLSEPYLYSPALIYDPALKLLAYSHKYQNFNDQIFQEAIRIGYLDPDTVDHFKQQHVFDTVHREGQALGRPDERRDHHDYIRAININQEIAVYCIVVDTGHMPQAYLSDIFDIFCNHIQRRLEREEASIRRNRSVSDHFLMDLIDNPDTTPEQIKERLHYLDLDYEGSYLVALLEGSNVVISSDRYFIQYLRDNLINSRVFPYHNQIVILYALPIYARGHYQEYLRHQFRQFAPELEKRALIATFSRPFETLAFFSAAYTQSDHLQTICRSCHMTRFFFYEDHWVFDLFYSNPSSQKLFSYCEPTLLDLIGQKTDRAANQLQILEEYLNCDRKMSDVAEHLNMHRNNVVYHIGRIEEHYHLDFNDAAVRLRFLNSFALLHHMKIL